MPAYGLSEIQREECGAKWNPRLTRAIFANFSPSRKPRSSISNGGLWSVFTPYSILPRSLLPRATKHNRNTVLFLSNGPLPGLTSLYPLSEWNLTGSCCCFCFLENRDCLYSPRSRTTKLRKISGSFTLRSFCERNGT